MNVDPTGPVRGTQAGRRADRGAARGGDFARHLDSSETSSSVSSTRPSTPVDSLLSVQQVDGDADADSQGKRRGHAILEMLEEIRRDMLDGMVDRSRLNRLSSMVAEGRDESMDPRLRGVLDEVELRAAVEIAKLEQADAEA